MTTKEITKLEHTATFGPDEEAKNAMKVLRKLNKTYHWCAEWDYLVICDKDREFECCTCFKGN